MAFSSGRCQGVERTLTAFATVAWQSARLAPMHDIEAVTMRATDAVHAALPKFSDNIGSKPVQRPRHRRWREGRRLIRRRCCTAAGNVHAPRRTGLDVIAIRSLGQGQRLPSLAPLRRRQCRDPAQPAVKLRHVHGSLLASQESAIADTNNQRHESQLLPAVAYSRVIAASVRTALISRNKLSPLVI